MPIISQMKGLILDNFAFQPTSEQQMATQMLAEFVFAMKEDGVCVLRGYAGTGKTSLVGALVKALEQLRQTTVLMAPTGRAAKVFALHAGHKAFTIHRRIYRQKAFTGDGGDFLQGVNLLKGALFIVDEASMIPRHTSGGQQFGTGSLLDDLIHFVYSSPGCRLMLIGDTAQLPPVGEAESPALESMTLAGYGLEVTEMTLTQVVRQLSDSGILWNATRLRQMLSLGELGTLPMMRFAGFADIKRISGAELIEELEQAYYSCGRDETIVVTRSNARANAYNKGIRARVLGMESELESGDHVLIVKNNYHWTRSSENSDDHNDATSDIDFIANGDIAVVRRLRHERHEHGFRFAEATLEFPDYADTEVDATILLDTLGSDAPALPREQQELLFQRVWDDYPEITTKRERMKAVREDPYFNALQLKYAYAVTCHKAQGGQWRRVFIDQGYVTDDMLDADYLRWLYTALTRATERVYLVNWPETAIDIGN